MSGERERVNKYIYIYLSSATLKEERNKNKKGRKEDN
jgi:hypothetical protein